MTYEEKWQKKPIILVGGMLHGLLFGVPIEALRNGVELIAYRTADGRVFEYEISQNKETAKFIRERTEFGFQASATNKGNC